jgi:hypothetical protein
MSETQKDWLLAKIDRMTKPNLIALICQAEADGHSPPDNLKSNLARRRWLQSCRHRHWNNVHSQPKGREAGEQQARQTSPTRRARADLCQITASEVNAMLRSFPEP